MAFQCSKYIFSHNPNLIQRYFVDPDFYFKFYGFEWVKVLPENGMHLCFCVLLFLAIMITIGAFYRISIVLFTIIFTYTFLIDQARYLNHFYMEILFSTLLCFMPAHRYFSVDSSANPKIKTALISFWPIFLLRAQMEIILIFAGLVKINYDWLHFMPLKIWLGAGSQIAILDYLFKQSWASAAASYGTIILHLVGAPLLLWKPGRIYIFCIYCVFHIINSFTFEIGVFPLLTAALTLIFFEPGWPKKILRLPTEHRNHFNPPLPQMKKIIVFLIASWIIIQIFIPLRYLLYPGNVMWTREGHHFSWRMKIEDSWGKIAFNIINPKTKETWKVIYPDKTLVYCRHDIILQIAHKLHKEWLEKRGQDVEIKAEALCSLNGREPQILIDPNVDLAKVKENFWHKDWIMPFDQRFDNEK